MPRWPSKDSAPPIKPKKADSKETACQSNHVVTGTALQIRDEGSTNEDKKEGKDQQPKRYVYRDFAKLPESEIDGNPETDKIDHEALLQAMEESTALAAAQTIQHTSPLNLVGPSPPLLRASGWVRSQRFPVKLYALLSQPQLSNVITWMPHGRSWKVLNQRAFETAVLPVFFESDNYHSFNRVINAWSFRRKSNGPDRGSYFHELFLRGKPHLQKCMRRLPRTHKKLAMAKEEEPDFYMLHTTSPLPTLEEARAASDVSQIQRLRQEIQRNQLQAMQNMSTLPFMRMAPR